MSCGWSLKFRFYFAEITHETLHLGKRRFAQWNVMHILTYKVYLKYSFLWRSFWIWRRFEILRYVRTNAELLCVEFCNTVHFCKLLILLFLNLIHLFSIAMINA
jgi:hypothetical protein